MEARQLVRVASQTHLDVGGRTVSRRWAGERQCRYPPADTEDVIETKRHFGLDPVTSKAQVTQGVRTHEGPRGWNPRDPE